MLVSREPSRRQRLFHQDPLHRPLENLDYQHEKSIRIFGSFLKEYRNREALGDVRGVAHVLDAGATSLEGRLVPFLVQEFVGGDSLESYLDEKFGVPPSGKFSGFVHASDWFDLSRRILQVVRRVHNRFVVHGDIWPSNLIIINGEPVLVDFGQSFMIDDYPDEPAGRIKQHPYLAPERVAPGKRWDMSADIYSVGGLLLYLATGRPPFAPVEDVEELKARVHRQITDANPGLLRQNMGITKVIDKCMRFNVVDRYPYVDDVLNALDLFDFEQTHEADESSPQVLMREIQSLLEALEGGTSSRLFVDLAAAELAVLKRQLDGMKRGHLILTAEREELINSLLRYLRVLDVGDEYLTVTVPRFWSPDNLGINGRFLTLNQMMAQKGVAVRRVFLLCESDKSDPSALAILRAHLRAMEEVEVDGVDTTTKEIDSSAGKTWYTGYVLIEEEERREAMTSGQHVAVWRKRATDELMSITFSQRPGTGDIGKVRFWSSPKLQRVVDDFIDRIHESSPLAEFMENVPETTRQSRPRRKS